MVRIVQLNHPEYGRRVAIVEEPNLVLLDQVSSTYQLALNAIDAAHPIEDVIKDLQLDSAMAYDPIYFDKSDWKLLPCLIIQQILISVCFPVPVLHIRLVPKTDRRCMMLRIRVT